MIAAGLSLRALARGAQWRLVVLWWASLLVPGFLAGFPVFRFLSSHLDRLPRARELVGALDGSSSVELVRQFGEAGNAGRIWTGVFSGIVALFLLSPFVAGAMVAAARSDEPLRFPRLLAGGGELYGRMLRVLVLASIPLGLGATLASALLGAVRRANERAIWESQALRRLRLAMAAAALVLFVAHLLVDLARAQFAADPALRSPLRAGGRAVALFLRRPLRAVSVGALGAFVAIVPAILLMALRMRIPQRTAAAVALAWLLAQAAQVAIGWGRAARIFGFAELTRTDAVDRSRAAFAMAPPTTSPPPAPDPVLFPAGSEPLSDPGVPEGERPLSPTGGSGT